ncbi:hypothetical protein NFJ02_19g34140 [Pycnococcus provasolii]
MPPFPPAPPGMPPFPPAPLGMPPLPPVPPGAPPQFPQMPNAGSPWMFSSYRVDKPQFTGNVHDYSEYRTMLSLYLASLGLDKAARLLSSMVINASADRAVQIN